MTHAICVRCGEMKFGSFTACKACGLSPVSARQLAYSIVFSDHSFDLDQLEEWSKEAIEKRMYLPLVSPETEEEYMTAFGLGRPVFYENEPDVLTPKSKSD